jgi:hypothetical protein
MLGSGDHYPVKKMDTKDLYFSAADEELLYCTQQ